MKTEQADASVDVSLQRLKWAAAGVLPGRLLILGPGAMWITPPARLSISPAWWAALQTAESAV